MSPTLTSAEAAAALGVDRRTLYAYVARGLVRSYPGPGRERRYDEAEVRALRAERDYRQTPLRAAADALRYGPPVLSSSVSAVRGGRLRYRGRDAADLVGSATFEETCAVLWSVQTVRFDRAGSSGETAPPAPDGDGDPLAAWLAALARLAAAHAPDGRDGATGPGVVAEGLRAFGARGPGRAAERLAGVWTQTGGELGADQSAVILDAALVALAEHELTAATLAARCAASTGGGLPAAVLAGLCALLGRRYAANTRRVADLLREAGTPDGLWDTLARRAKAGRPTPGFGHRLYPDGDPRARALLAVLDRAAPDAEGTAWLRAAESAGPGVVGAHPAADFALVAACRAAGLDARAPLWAFALARSAGFVAHAEEQVASGLLIRPRASTDDP